MPHGTWQTTDSGSAAPVLLVVGVLVLLGSGGAATLAATAIEALIAAVAVLFLAAVALAVFLACKARNPSPEGVVRTPLVRSTVHELPRANAEIPHYPPERPAIGPREVHQHWHLHFGADADPQEVAAIMRHVREDDNDG